MTVSFNTHKLSMMVEDVLSEFDASKLVVIHIPSIDNAEEWANLICVNINKNIHSEFDYIQQYDFNNKDQPKDFLNEVFSEQSTDFSWEKVLEDNAHAKPVYVWIDMQNHNEYWSVFFENLVRAYQSWDREYYCKKIVLILLGLEIVPRWIKSPAVRYFQFWNVISWEEMRTLAKGWLIEDENPYFNEWQISSYVGAARLDPFLLYQLCMNSPVNFNSIKEEIKKISYNKPQNNFIYTSRLIGESWRIPVEIERFWLSGCISGISLDRGINQSWSSIKYTDRDLILIQSIWSEQVVSLFQIIAHLSDASADCITKYTGSTQWMLQAEALEFGYINEPSVIIKLVNEKRLGHLPSKLWCFLHDLRSIRNSLAHREYIDSGAMRKLLAIRNL